MNKEQILEHLRQKKNTAGRLTIHTAYANTIDLINQLDEPLSHFQSRVAPWMEACFGSRISADTSERNHRFIEESLELVQSGGMPREDAHALVDYVYNRPVGDPPQEVGGVMVTLAALCLAAGMDMHQAAEVELDRVWGKIEQIRAKQSSKPRNSPLPEYADCAPLHTDAMREGEEREAFKEWWLQNSPDQNFEEWEYKIWCAAKADERTRSPSKEAVNHPKLYHLYIECKLPTNFEQRDADELLKAYVQMVSLEQWRSTYQPQSREADEQKTLADHHRENVRCMTEVFDQIADALGMPNAKATGNVDALFHRVQRLRAYELFYGPEAKNIGQIIEATGLSLYELSPWLTAAAIRIATDARLASVAEHTACGQEPTDLEVERQIRDEGKGRGR